MAIIYVQKTIQYFFPKAFDKVNLFALSKAFGRKING